MSTTIKTQWLLNKAGEKVAPKTLISQVITHDGVTLEEKITEDLLLTKEEIETNITSQITTHTDNKSNPHEVTLSQLEVTATAEELNYCDGVTSNIQTQLNEKMDLTSAQTVNGIKTFSDGIQIGDAMLSYDSTNKCVVITVL